MSPDNIEINFSDFVISHRLSRLASHTDLQRLFPFLKGVSTTPTILDAEAFTANGSHRWDAGQDNKSLCLIRHDDNPSAIWWAYCLSVYKRPIIVMDMIEREYSLLHHSLKDDTRHTGRDIGYYLHDSRTFAGVTLKHVAQAELKAA